jgi:spermidine synthase
MSDATTMQSGSNATLWIHNLVDDLAGMTIKAKHAVFCGSSSFQKVEVYDTYAFGRIMVLAGSLMFTEADEFIYHEMISHPALMKHGAPKSVCIIGGGDGGCLRQVLKYKSVREVTVVEIDAMVRKTVEQYFPDLARSFSDKRVRMVIDDGYTFLEKSTDRFDVIIIDSYDPGGPVQSLETAGFFALVGDHCADNGVVVFQTDSPLIKADFLRKTILGAGPYFKAWRPYICAIPSFPAGICSFLLCAQQAGALDRETRPDDGVLATCRYVNAEVLTGAFLLPQNIRQTLA